MPKTEGMDGLRRQAKRMSESWRHRIGASVRRIRDARGFSQGDLAALVGVDVATISKTELGRTVPDYATIESMADVLNVPLDELVGRAMPPVAEVGSRDPWPAIAVLQSQLDELREVIGQNRDRLPELKPKPSRKARRNA